VRHLAHDLGIDINQLTGTGKEGRVTAEDLKHGIAHREHTVHEAIEGDEEQPLIGVRGLMARKMDQTRIPQFSYFEKAEVSRLIQMRKNIKDKAEAEGIALSYMPFLIRALSLTAARYPIINSSLDMHNSKLILHKQHNIGIAIASSQGLIVPVLKGVQAMGLEEIIRAFDTLKIKASTGKLQSADMKGATITISNFGAVPGEGMWATPMVSDPEVAILAVARMRQTAGVKHHELAVMDVLPLSWSFDHRVIDGEMAALVSHYYATLLRDPALLL
jgi:pyruvate dehydrogenase E2 component (dihydrolipoamide acetyltransferase)/2-oxoisovalerate dehydrogenase E2 component (dihydrolipoyl transacylase)